MRCLTAFRDGCAPPRALALMQEVERSFVGLEHIARQALALPHRRLYPATPGLPARAGARVGAARAGVADRIAPDLAVQVQPFESPWLEEAVAAQRCDGALGETRDAPPAPSATCCCGTSEVAVLPASHSLCCKRAYARRFRVTDLHQPGRRRPLSPGHRCPVCRTRCGATHHLETASAVAACAMVRHGLGVTIVNPLTALELAGPDLAVRPECGDSFEVSLLPPTVAAFPPAARSAGAGAYAGWRIADTSAPS